MGQILQNWRVISAALFSAVLVVGAYLFARATLTPLAQASAETALLQAIATRDSDNDGLRDWEEVLYGTSADNPDSFMLGMTDGEAVAKGLIVPKAITEISMPTPTSSAGDGVDYAAFGLTAPIEGTLTDAFAKSFFSLYLATKEARSGALLTSAETSALADTALQQLSEEFGPAADFKTAADLTVSGSGPEALRSYAAAAEAVFRNHTTDATMSDIEYLQAAVQEEDESALAQLEVLAKAYRSSAAGLVVLTVPAEISADILAIVNSIMRLGKIQSDFARVDRDPLTAMLALQQYRQTEIAAERAFTALAGTYTAHGVVLSSGTPGAAFVNLMTDLGATPASGGGTL